MKKATKKLRILFEKIITKPEWVFLILIIPFGIASAFLVPQLSVNDENWHFARAYQVSDGLIVCDDDKVTYPNEINDKIYDAIERKYSDDYSQVADLDVDHASECGAMESYLPTMYIPQSLGILFAKLVFPSPAFMVLMARFFNLVLYALASFFLIKRLKHGKWVLVVLALFPQMVHLAASTTTDPINNVVIMAIIVFLLNLFFQTEKICRSQIITLIGLAVLAAATKQNNVILFFPLAFLPKQLFDKNKIKRIPFNLQKWSMNLLAGLSFSSAFIVFQKFLISATVLPVIDTGQLGNNPFSFIKLLYNTYFTDYGDVVFIGISNHFSSFGYHLPLIITVALVVLFVIALLYKQKNTNYKVFNLKNSSVFLATLGISIIAVTYIMYTAWVPAWTGGEAIWAEGVQGRYFTAMLLLFVPFGIWLQKHISVSFKSKKAIGWMVFISLLIILTYYTFLTYKYTNDGLLWTGGYLRL
jgi:Predicted membrane protein